MKEITQDNYKQLEYNWGGVIVAYPNVDLYFNADFYFIKQKINYETDERTYFYSGVNQEDEVSEISPDWKKQDFESCFKDWENLKYYQFENMKEFCEWHIHKDDIIKKSIKDFKNKVYFEQKYGFNPYEEDLPEGLGYWVIYNDEKCDNELKRIIEKKFPEIKELASFEDKIRKQYRCEDIYTNDEIRDKINPGWNTRRQKLQDVIKLLELRDLRQNTIDMLKEKITPEKRCYLEKQLERDEKRIEEFLDEKIN